jgi:hypothetical protein
MYQANLIFLLHIVQEKKNCWWGEEEKQSEKSGTSASIAIKILISKQMNYPLSPYTMDNFKATYST